MKIEMWLPIAADAKFTADIDIKGKTADEVFKEFLGSCESIGSLCHQCSNGIQSDIELLYDIVERDLDDYISEIAESISLV